MHTARLLTALTLATLSMTGVAAARPSPPAEPSQLYTLDKASQPVEAIRSLVPDAAEDFAIQTDPAKVAANPPAFLLELPGLPTLEAIRTSFVSYRQDWKSWFGTLRRAGSVDEPAGYVYLGYHGQQLTGMIELEGQRYRIVGEIGKGHHLVRLDDTLSQPSCAFDSAALAAAARKAPAGGSAQQKPGTAIVPKATNRLDTLIVYPRAYFSLGASAQATLKTFVQDSISLANNIFVNSNVDAAYNLVGVVPITGVNQPPATGLFTGLEWMTGQPAEVTSLRSAFGADIVALYIPFSWNGAPYCGVANLPQNNNTFISTNVNGQITVAGDMGNRAFTTNRDGCGLNDFTLGHEIGHNYGMYHGDQAASGTAIDPNARGYIFTSGGVTRATVMNCYCPAGNDCSASANPVCNRVPYFSDPNILYGGVPIGTATNNNAGFARTRVATYAGFFAQSTNTPPTANFNVSCSGHTCTFTSTSTDNVAIPVGGYWWDFGDGTTGTGSSVTHIYGSTATSFTTFNVNLVVTDSGGQTGAKASTASTGPIYEGYHELSDCRTISGWAWDQGAPNYSINVDLLKDGGFFTTLAANLFRQDLVNAGKGNGYHAFVYTPSSSWKDGQWHTPTVRFSGTSTNLTWSPRNNIICGVSCFPSLTPTENNSTGGVIYTVGTQLSSSNSGYITHLRFYRAAGESGTNTGQLWTDGGSLLAQATFPSFPSSGWVEVALSSPVAISAGTRYRVSVNTNVQQSKTSCGIGSGITNQVLTAHQGVWVAGNAVFPTTGSCSNFFVDVKFEI